MPEVDNPCCVTLRTDLVRVQTELQDKETKLQEANCKLQKLQDLYDRSVKCVAELKSTVVKLNQQIQDLKQSTECNKCQSCDALVDGAQNQQKEQPGFMCYVEKVDVGIQVENLTSDLLREDVDNLVKDEAHPAEALPRTPAYLTDQPREDGEITERSVEEAHSKDQADVSMVTSAWVAATAEDEVEEGEIRQAEPQSIADSLREAAEAAQQQTSFVYDEKTGLYYDQQSGYYYDAERSLYYDAYSGTYYYLDPTTNRYEFHSQADFSKFSEEACKRYCQNLAGGKDKKAKKKKKRKENEEEENQEPKKRKKKRKIDKEDDVTYCKRKHSKIQESKRKSKDQKKHKLSSIDHDPDSSRSTNSPRKHRSRERSTNSPRKHRSRERSRNHRSQERSTNSPRKHRSRERSRKQRSRERSTNSTRKHRSREKSQKKQSTSKHVSHSLTKNGENNLVEEAIKTDEEKSEDVDTVMEKDSCTQEHPDPQNLDDVTEEGEVEDSSFGEEEFVEDACDKSTPLCTSSSEEEDSSSDSSSSESSSSSEDDNPVMLARYYPPCIRAIVKQSDCLDPGGLIIITCSGATIGREKELHHELCIPDDNVSKMHCDIKYNETLRRYEVKDHASQNGTFINGHRLSETKYLSEPYPVSNRDMLRVGGTSLELHIHPGTETCDDCEPGLVQDKLIPAEPSEPTTQRVDKEKQRRSQLKQIRKKYGLEHTPYKDETSLINRPGYTDKASERRQTVGSDNPYQKDEAPASVHRAISSKNKGHKLLSKLGWKEGESLGKSQEGLKEPITVQFRTNQAAGLGSASAHQKSLDNVTSAKHTQRWLKTQERFRDLDNKQGQGQGQGHSLEGGSQKLYGTNVKRMQFLQADTETFKEEMDAEESPVTMVTSTVDATVLAHSNTSPTEPEKLTVDVEETTSTTVGPMKWVKTQRVKTNLLLAQNVNLSSSVFKQESSDEEEPTNV